jgi:hypothetical protein
MPCKKKLAPAEIKITTKANDGVNSMNATEA